MVIPIAIYLFIFYISTSYSAFFKNFESDVGFFDLILDPNAFLKSWQEGALQGMFVTFIPFVFLGLGYLIHMFGEKKNIVNNLKITALFILTFVFDAILAYLIESKLYGVTKTFDSPPFDMIIAFQEVSFWGIIFAGFVSYIIFGLVFDFVMKEHEKRDIITKLENEIHTLKENIEKYEACIKEFDRIISDIIIPVKEYELYASQYMQGWLKTIHKTTEGPKQVLIKGCNEVYFQHMKEKKGTDNNDKNNKTDEKN